jgi:hypothetical protein
MLTIYRKDGKKGKELSLKLKGILNLIDPEVPFKLIAEQECIEVEELYNLANHLKYWKVADIITALDSYSYFSYFSPYKFKRLNYKLEPLLVIHSIARIGKKLKIPNYEEISHFFSNNRSWNEIKEYFSFLDLKKLKLLFSTLVSEKVILERFLHLSFSESKYAEVELFLEEISNEDKRLIEKIRKWSKAGMSLKECYPLGEMEKMNLLKVTEEYSDFLDIYFT